MEICSPAPLMLARFNNPCSPIYPLIPCACFIRHAINGQ
jgi:hypothetical protein